MNAYVEYFDKNSKYMNFLGNDEEILENCNKKFDIEPVYNDKYIRAKINLHVTKFQGNKTPTEGEHYTCFSVILLDSIVNVDKKYYSQIFLK